MLDLVNVLPAGLEDYEARVLMTFMVELRRAIETDPDGWDANGRVKLARLKMRDVVLRMTRRLEHRTLEVPEEAVRFIFATLNGIGVSELSELLGVSTKTINAWRQGSPVKTNVSRAHTVAEVLLYLRGSMTSRGLILWFAAKHDALGGKIPLKILDAERPEGLLALVEYARGGRGQLAD